MRQLSVNINKIALLRNARDGDRPNLLYFAGLALDAGAHGITVHPRPDQRHITAQDTRDLTRYLKAYRAENPGNTPEFNMEGNPFEGELGSFPGFLNLVKEASPDQVTLVPDALDQKTSDHGWDFKKDGDRLAPIVKELQGLGLRVSVFVDPIDEAIDGAHELGVDRVEFYTEDYARAHAKGEGEASFNVYARLAEKAHALGLEINAGHDLNLENLPLFSTLPHLQEVSIGQALVTDALELGFNTAVKAYLRTVQEKN